MCGDVERDKMTICANRGTPWEAKIVSGDGGSLEKMEGVSVTVDDKKKSDQPQINKNSNQYDQKQEFELRGT